MYGYSDDYSGSLRWLWLRPYFMFNGENFLRVVANTDRPEYNEEFVVVYSCIVVVSFLVGNALMMNLLVAIFNEIFNCVFTRYVVLADFNQSKTFGSKTIQPT